ncbi:MAG: hypothetical protein IPI57_10055 [Candidatus Competibacteraceae bacterium]|nr:hypothetical protein [Candidatus Competibacteraceae bacterium]
MIASLQIRRASAAAIDFVLTLTRLAYKIEKPVNLGFLDFTSLERRKDFCEKELRLNGRLAPELYLKCVTIGDQPTGAGSGGTLGSIDRSRCLRFR